MKWNLVIAVFLVGMLPLSDFDKIKLNNGDKIEGRIAYLDNEVVEIKTDYGFLIIERKKVKKIKLANVDRRVRTRSLEAHYPLDGNAEDRTENNDGKARNLKGVRNRFRQRNKALYFDGYKDFIEIKDDRDHRPKKELTLSVWVKPSKDTRQMPIVWKGLKDRRQEIPSYAFQTTNSIGRRSYFAFLLYNDKTDRLTQLTSKTEVDTDRWTFLTATFDGDQVKLYVNGLLESTMNFDGKIDYDKDFPLLIGADSDKKRGFKGIIDDVRIYDHPLDEKEIRTLFFKSE